MLRLPPSLPQSSRTHECLPCAKRAHIVHVFPTNTRKWSTRLSLIGQLGENNSGAEESSAQLRVGKENLRKDHFLRRESTGWGSRRNRAFRSNRDQGYLKDGGAVVFTQPRSRGARAAAASPPSPWPAPALQAVFL